ncbi:hypothetical protein D3C72_2398430 [compost metagenome]
MANTASENALYRRAAHVSRGTTQLPIVNLFLTEVPLGAHVSRETSHELRQPTEFATNNSPTACSPSVEP